MWSAKTNRPPPVYHPQHSQVSCIGGGGREGWKGEGEGRRGRVPQLGLQLGGESGGRGHEGTLVRPAARQGREGRGTVRSYPSVPFLPTPTPPLLLLPCPPWWTKKLKTLTSFILRTRAIKTWFSDWKPCIATNNISLSSYYVIDYLTVVFVGPDKVKAGDVWTQTAELVIIRAVAKGKKTTIEFSDSTNITANRIWTTLVLCVSSVLQLFLSTGVGAELASLKRSNRLLRAHS